MSLAYESHDPRYLGHAERRLAVLRRSHELHGHDPQSQSDLFDGGETLSGKQRERTDRATGRRSDVRPIEHSLP